MATFALLPGAGGDGWFWHRVVPLLEAAQHTAIPIDLPAEDDAAGLSVYVERVVAAIGSRSDVVLVAHSLAGFVSPLVAARVPLSRLVFVNAMLPLPGETAGEWGAATGSAEARIAAARRGGYSQKFDDETYFFHDVPRAIVEQAEARYKEQSEAIFDEPCRFERWPDVPIQVIAGRDDRLFPIEFQRRIARERLGLEVDEIAGGHLAALSNPRGLVAEVTSR